MQLNKIDIADKKGLGKCSQNTQIYKTLPTYFAVSN